MFKALIPLILSAGLLLVLMLGSQRLGILVPAALGIVVLTVGLNYFRVGLLWPRQLLPLLFLVGVIGTSSIIPQPSVRILFLIASVMAFYYLESQLGRESHFLQSMFLVSVFLINLSIFGVSYYFAAGGLLWSMLLFALFTMLITLQGFAGITGPSKQVFSILVMLILIEAVLGLLLWPSHFLVEAIVLFLMFYVLWSLATAAFFGKLTTPKVYWQLILVGIVLIVTLSSATWLPLK